MKLVANPGTALFEPRACPERRVAVRATGTFLVLVAVGGLTKIVGLLREMVLAADFGASRQMDAYLVAQTLPSAVQRVFDELLGATVLPLFAGWQATAGQRAAWSQLFGLLRTMLLLCCLLVVVAMALARPLLFVLAPGLDAGSARVAVRSLEIMLPSVAFVVVGTVCTALLNFYHRYVWTAVIALAGNLTALACIVLYARRLGVYSAAIGITLSTLLVAALQWRALPQVPRGGTWLPEGRPWLREFARLAGPLGVGVVLFNLVPLVERFLASWLPAGKIALLNYAFKVDWLVYMIFVFSITTMLFPRLAAAGAAGNHEQFTWVLATALKAAFLVLLPTMILLAVEGNAVVRLLYQRGSFTAAHTAETAAILKVYLLGLPGAAATLILFYALYALKQPAGRVVAGALGLGVSLGCGWIGVRVLGARGIALTHALNFSLMALLLGGYMRRALGPEWGHSLRGFFVRVTSAGAITLLLTWLAAGFLERTLPGASALFAARRVALCALIAVGSFAAFCWVVRVGEVHSLVSELRRYLWAAAKPRSETPE